MTDEEITLGPLEECYKLGNDQHGAPKCWKRRGHEGECSSALSEG